MTVLIALLSAFTDLLSPAYILFLLLLPVVLNTPYILWERRMVVLVQQTYSHFLSKQPSPADAQQAFRSALASATST